MDPRCLYSSLPDDVDCDIDTLLPLLLHPVYQVLVQVLVNDLTTLTGPSEREGECFVHAISTIIYTHCICNVPEEKYMYPWRLYS